MASLKPIEFGVFMPVANNGWLMSTTAPQYMPTWKLLSRIGMLAEDVGFHYLFSMGKWRGLGGETKFWNYSVEPLTLTSALATVTSKVRLVASVSPILIHPAVFSKMAVTVDDVAEGRLSINIVTADDEYGQMGLYPEDFHPHRYDYYEEWLAVAKRLWSEERVTFKGEYFTLDDCMSGPKPVQQPHPRIVCAVSSDRGFQFVAERCDEAFFGGTSVAAKKAGCEKARAASRKSGRPIKTQTLTHVVQGATDAEAEAMMQHFRDGADHEAIANVGFGGPEQRPFYGGVPLVGGPEKIVDYMAELAIDGDIDGVLVTFPDFIDGLEKFRDGIIPLLASRGLELAPRVSTEAAPSIVV
ncbi:MAG: class flavin-dependent oxidoreductase [Chloroflexi bacterium]|nr:class flavin-dependent oxidoreductase [Chloroflexota bacterium]